MFRLIRGKPLSIYLGQPGGCCLVIGCGKSGSAYSGCDRPRLEAYNALTRKGLTVLVEPIKGRLCQTILKNSLGSRARRNRGNQPGVLRIEVRSQPNLQRVSGVCTKVLVRATGKMSESAKYIWCQHCYTGWIAKEDKPYYPKCWSCGMGWRKRTRRSRWWSAQDAWDAQWPQTYPAQEVGYYPPPGLGSDDRS